MKIKVNEGFHANIHREGKFYKRFKAQFDILLNPDKNSKDFESLDKIYVEDKFLAEKLSNFINTDRDFCQFLVGPTGIGKSTALRRYLNIKREEKPIFKIMLDANEDIVKKRKFSLIMPILCNSTSYKDIDIKKKIADMVEVVCERLKKKSDWEFDPEGLYDFIYENKPILLTEVREHKEPSKEENINWLYKYNKFAYGTELLKLYLLKNSDLKDFILVVDDVDSIENGKTIRELIHQVCKVWECLKNNDRKYNVKLIIAERPETEKILQVNHNWMSAYVWKSHILINNVIPLSDLFFKRFDYLASKSKGGYHENRNKWEKAYNVLKKVCSELTLRNENIIADLCNYNIRDSLKVIEETLAGCWLEKKHLLKDSGGGFDVTDENFFENIDTIPLLRAIGYQHNEVYIDDNSTSIVNLLKNEEETDCYLSILYVIKYFTNNKSKGYSLNYDIDITELYTKLPKIFTFKENIIKDIFFKSIKYLISRKVLFISINDSGENTKLFLSPRGKILWELFASNNVLVELYHDDMWIESSDFDVSPSQKINIDNRFIEGIKIANLVGSNEMEIVNNLMSHESRKLYLECFGKESIVEHIARGISLSIIKYYDKKPDKKPPINVKKEFDLLCEKVTRVRELLNNEEQV